MTNLIIDGKPIHIKDALQAGRVKEQSVVMSNQGVQEIIQPTELGETLKQLNDDSLESETRMSGIDMRARLHYLEINSVLALDAITALGICPTKCLAFTRQKKRLSVSESGKGREEIVTIVAGKKEQDAKTGVQGFGQRVANFVGMNK